MEQIHTVIWFIFCRANWVRVCGTKYQTPCILVIGSKDDEPIFGDIDNVLVLVLVNQSLRFWKQNFVIIIMHTHCLTHCYYQAQHQEATSLNTEI